MIPMLAAWAATPDDATALMAAADALEEAAGEAENGWADKYLDAMFAARWMLLNDRRPGRRKEIRRRPWVWLFDVRLPAGDSFHRSIRRRLPAAVLPAAVYRGYPPHFLSFADPLQAFLDLSNRLAAGRRVYGYDPRVMPTKPFRPAGY